MNVKYLIAGAGYTGVTAAVMLRQLDPQGTILLVGAEKQLPYRRYTLTKEYLKGDRPLERMPLRPASFYVGQNIQTRFGVNAVSLDVERRQVRLDNNEIVTFERLLLATGAMVRRLSLPGVELEGVYYLRTLEDSDRLRQEMQTGRRALIIGGGFIGAEVAASLVQKGLRATIVQGAPTLWAHLFGEEMGRFFHDAMGERGVDIRASSQVQRLEGSRRVERAVLADQSVIHCDFVVIGVGVRPDTALAEAAGLKVDNGISVNEFLETDIPGIFAGGDVAKFYHPLFQASMRIEHWNVAYQHGAIAARNMAAQRVPYNGIPEFFSELFELNIEWLGYAPAWERLVIRRFQADKFAAFYLSRNRIVGALLVNDSEDLKAVRLLIERQREIADVEALTKPTESLGLGSQVI